MSSDERIREDARPHGVVAAGCHTCPLLSNCGGIEPERSLFDCFAHYCCGGKEDCDDVCPHNRTFFARMDEVGGLRFDNVASLSQAPVELPKYVPLIHHGYSHRKPLDLPIVALDTYDLFHLRDKKYQTIATNGVELRKQFGLSPGTKIVLRGTARDNPLERYWSYRRRDRAAEQLASLDIQLAIGPNFSHFLDVPRTDNLFNRKRQLICLAEISNAGIVPVPHLSAVTPGDWRFWQSFLERNESVSCVAAEFQTGNKNFVEGQNVIEKIALAQDAIRRRLHPLIVGGTQFAKNVASRFDTFTLIDSSPFMKAIKRRKFDKTAGRLHWTDTYTLDGQGVEEIILQNLKGHTDWIEKQFVQRPTRK